LKIARIEDNNKYQADILINLGNIHSNLTDYDKAFENYTEALKIAKSLNDNRLMSICYSNFGVHYYRKEKFEDALKYTKKSLEINEQTGARIEMVIPLNTIGVIYYQMNDFEQALDYYQRSLQISEELGLKYLIAQTMMNFGVVYRSSGKTDMVAPALDKAIVIAKEINSDELLHNIYYHYAEYYAETGDFQKAYENYKLRYQLFEEISKARENKSITEIRTRYEIEKKDQETEIIHLKNVELSESNQKLQEALDQIEVLSGLIPICANCKNIRDDEGFWLQQEDYITEHSDLKFTHGICPDCKSILYPELSTDKK